MSSSRRSSQNTPPPTWRRASMSRKDNPPPSVSLIFAQPEQSPPSQLGSAAAKLSPSRIGKRERTNSTRSVGGISAYGTNENGGLAVEQDLNMVRRDSGKRPRRLSISSRLVGSLPENASVPAETQCNDDRTDNTAVVSESPKSSSNIAFPPVNEDDAVAGASELIQDKEDGDAAVSKLSPPSGPISGLVPDRAEERGSWFSFGRKTSKQSLTANVPNNTPPSNEAPKMQSLGDSTHATEFLNLESSAQCVPPAGTSTVAESPKTSSDITLPVDSQPEPLNSTTTSDELKAPPPAPSASWFGSRRQTSKATKVVDATPPEIASDQAGVHVHTEDSITELPSPPISSGGPLSGDKATASSVASAAESSKPKAAQSSAGWFGSRKQTRMNESEPPLQVDLTESGVEQKSHAGPKSSEPISVQVPSTRSLWFSPQSPPRPTAPAHTHSVPSSIDEEVPDREEATPPRSPSPILVSNQGHHSKLSSLNPTTSRFTLSLPLLGRPKIPLDRVVLQAEGGEQKPTLVEAGLPSISEPQQYESQNQGNAPVTQDATTVLASASWWDYVGLGGNASRSPASIQEPSESVSEAVSPSVRSSTDAPTSPEQATSGELTPQPTPPKVGRPSSILSSETASAWLSPSGWYSWYSQQPAPAVPEETPKTEAELVKEEALARPDPQTARAPALATPSDLPNPIVSTLPANTKGWASFFSSRALMTKSVTEKGEAGMEVMDLDDDDDAGANQPVAPNQHQPSPVVGPQQKKERKKQPPAPLTGSDSIKRKVTESQRAPSPSSSSKKSIPPPTPRLPNLVLPTFDDTFRTAPRSKPPPPSPSTSTLKKTLGFVSGVLFARDQDEHTGKGKLAAREKELEEFGKELPRAWDVLKDAGMQNTHAFHSCRKVVVIGIHGWFPGAAVRTVLGEPTGTSTKFSNMMSSAVEAFAEKHGAQFDQITKIPLEGEGKIEQRIERLYQNLTGNQDWMDALRAADVIFIATHSQGSIVSTHLISRLILDGYIRTARNLDLASSAAASIAPGGAAVVMPAGKQRVCCLALCGIHLGPFAYLHKSSLVQPYIQYFESAAASELFEFQHTESQVSKDYIQALRHVLDHGVKLVYIASLNDQVVPIYSGAFTAASHPLILRALYIDGDAYSSSDFLSNLLVLLMRIRNAGLSDGSLLAHLSEATAGSLSGVGHSSAYEELATFSLAVDYLFLTNDGFGESPDLCFEPFNARSALNDYEIPWALRDVIADEHVVHLFWQEFAALRESFDDWQPRTSILRDLKRKLEPIRRLKLSPRL